MNSDQSFAAESVSNRDQPARQDSVPLEVLYDEQLQQLNSPLTSLPDSEYSKTLRLLHDVFRGRDTRLPTTISEISDTLDEIGQSKLSISMNSPVQELGAVQRQLPGRFILQRKLGEGGFGSVYLATDQLLQREVAVKVPHRLNADSIEVRIRFLRESRAVARLNHPSIVRVLDSGEESGHAWQITEYVAGSHLKEFLEQSGGVLPVRVAAFIVQQLADAVHHAHSHGVLHRDIKPENIVLERLSPELLGCGPVLADSPASLQYLPRLIDFGLARIVDDEISVSRSGLLVGTPKYMAPEQLHGRMSQQGPSTDIYSLGVVLHELLTGFVPFPEATTLPLRILASEKTVRSLRSSGRSVPVDLETICLKCLSHNAFDRYASAGELRDDLARFLDGRPTSARPLPMYEQLQRWARRNRAIATAICLVSISMLVVLGQAIVNDFNSQKRNKELLSTLNQLQAEKSRSDGLLKIARESNAVAAENESKFRTLAWNSSIREALDRLVERKFFAVSELLRGLRSSQPEKLRRPELQLVSSELQRHYEVLMEVNYPLRELRIVPGRTLIAVAGESPVVSLIDTETQQLTYSFRTEVNEIHAMAVSSDGKWIAVGGCTNAADVAVPAIYSLEQGTLVKEFAPQPTTIESLLFTSDGKFLICGCRYQPIRIFNLENGTEASLPATRRNLWLADNLDGSRIVAHEDDQTLVVSDPASPSTKHVLTFPDDVEHCIRIAGTNLLVITSYQSQHIDIVDLNSGRRYARARHSGKALTSIAFCDISRKLMAGCADGSIVCWTLPKSVEASVTTAAASTSTPEFEDLTSSSGQRLDDQPIASMCVAQKSLFCATESGRVVVLRFPNETVSIIQRREHQAPFCSVAVDPASGDIFLGASTGRISRVARQNLQCTQSHQNSLTALEREGLAETLHEDLVAVDGININRGGTRLTWSNWTRRVQVEELMSGKRQQLSPVSEMHDGGIDAIEYSPDDCHVAWTGIEKRLVSMNTAGPPELSEYRLPGYGNTLGFSPDSKLIAVGGSFEGIIILELPRLTNPRLLSTTKGCTVIQWGLDGESLLIGYSNGAVSVCPLDGSRAPRFSIHRNAVRQIVVDKNRELAVSVDETGQAALWNPRTAEVLGVLFEPAFAKPYLVDLAPTLQFIDAGELMLVYDDGVDGVQAIQWRIDQ